MKKYPRRRIINSFHQTIMYLWMVVSNAIFKCQDPAANSNQTMNICPKRHAQKAETKTIDKRDISKHEQTCFGSLCVIDHLCVEVIGDSLHQKNCQCDDTLGVKGRQRPKDLVGTSGMSEI
jgi:hypothetical protein